ncbi:hypothetical protein ACFUJR_27880 [Streptomyces sp. NPDC057271]|uniref:hypothetical protein n=1 Tax=unclassified Streptomyces TaxID=2593676 RepID=UPI00362BFE07
MADALPLAVLALVLVGALTVAVIVCCALVATGRGLGTLLRRTPAPAAAAPPGPVRDGRVWIACHTPRCGHLATIHHPTVDGLFRCDACGTVRPRP